MIHILILQKGKWRTHCIWHPPNGDMEWFIKQLKRKFEDAKMERRRQ